MPFLSSLSANQQTVAKVLSSFGIAPTADLLAVGGDYFAAGGSQSALYDLLAGYFATNGGTAYAGYASTSTDAEFAATLVAQLTAGTSISQTVTDAWVTVLADALTAGAYTRGAMMSGLVTLIDSLTSSTTTDADLLALANVLDNRAEVGAAYASSSAGATFTDLATVNAAVTGVTNDSASVATAISTNFGSSMPAPTTFTVTSSINSIMEGAAAATITVTANTATYAPISFTYNVSPGTVTGVSAGSSADVQTATGTVTIPAGATSATFTITAASDTSTEGLEALLVSVLGSNNASVGSVTLTVQDAPGGTFTLTTAADQITGTVGDDTIAGTLPYSGTLDSSATLTAGDIISGGSGTDTLTITVSGSNLPVAATATASPNLTGVEKVLVSNVASETTGGEYQVIDLALADSALTTVGTSSSTTAGVLTKFSNVGQIGTVDMAGKGDVQVAYTTTTGTTDAVTLNLKGVGTSSTVLSTFTTAGIETINVASGTAANYAKITADTSLTKVAITGSKALTLDLNGATNTAITTVDASAATGKVTVNAAGLGITTVTATGGTATDDTYSTDQAISASSKLSKVTGFEVLAHTGVASVSLDAALTNISTISLTNSANTTLTFASGYTGATTVNLTGDAGDSVTDNANIALTVNANVANVTTGTTLDAGTGTTDVLNLTADGIGATLTSVTDFETINILANTTTATTGTGTITTVDGNVASTKTLVVDASALTSSSATLVFDGAAETNGHFSVTGGAGNDTLTGGAGNDYINGGAGLDSIVAGTGTDNINGGAGNDTINMGSAMTNADTIDGGDGTDKLIISSLATSDALKNVTNVENVAFSGAATVSLSASLGASITIDLSDSSGQTVTLASGYTGDTAFKLTGDDTNTDSITNSANVAMTVAANAADIDAATVIDGGTGTDSITLTADDGTATISGVLDVETITVAANTSDATKDIVITVNAADTVVASTKTLTIDASALTSSTATLTFTGTGETNGYFSITGGAGNDTITGSASNETISGGAGADSINGGTGGLDSISGGDGNDTINMSSGFSFGDTIDGGSGTDKLLLDANAAYGNSGEFSSITNVESVALANTLTLNLSNAANSFTSFDTSDTANQIINFNAGYTSAATVSLKGDSTTNEDTVVNTGANIALTVSGYVSDFDTGTTITGGTGTDTLTMTADSGSAVLTNVSALNAITLVAGTVGTESAKITTANGNLASGKSMTVDASALTSAFTYDGSAEADGKISITGSAGADAIVLGAGADTVNAGGGADYINAAGGINSITTGSGADLVLMNAPASSSLAFSTITDFSAGDALAYAHVGGSEAFTSTAVTLSAAATLSDYISSVTSGTTAGVIKWFQFGGNTYVVQDVDTGTSFVLASDRVIELTGALDLSTATLDATDNTLTWASTKTTTLPTSVDLTGATAGIIYGTSGNDTITGAVGADTIYGGGGDDSITIVSASTVDGGAGTDTLTLTTGDATIGTGSIDNVEAIVLTGDGIDLTINGADLASNAITSVTGNTTGGTVEYLKIGAAAGATNLDFSAMTFTNAAVSVTGSAGADTIKGGSAADTIATNGGNDTVTGGGGADAITLGGGVDKVVFESTAAANGADTIAAFLTAGADKLDFTAFLGGAASVNTTGVLKATGLDLTGTNNVGVVANWGGALATGDIATAAAANKVAIEDNSKAVVLSNLDADGTGSTVDWAIYYVQDTDTSTSAQTFTVTLVGTLTMGGSTTIDDMSEMAAAALYS